MHVSLTAVHAIVSASVGQTRLALLSPCAMYIRAVVVAQCAGAATLEEGQVLPPTNAVAEGGRYVLATVAVKGTPTWTGTSSNGDASLCSRS